MMNDCCREGERLDDLQIGGLRIIQHPDKFCFGMDAVLLSSIAQVKKGERVLDLGTGTGILPILLEHKTQGEHFTGLEIQAESADMATRSVRFNGQEERIDIVQGDIKEAAAIFGKASFSVVTVNPPYMNHNHGLVNPELPMAIARHEILCTLEDVVREAAACLKVNGRLYMVHRPFRLVEIINMLSAYHLETKHLRMVQPYEGKEPNMVLIEAVKGGRSMVRVDAPLIIYEKPGVYTREIREIYDTANGEE